MEHLKFYEFRNHPEYILDQYGCIYYSSTKQKVDLEKNPMRLGKDYSHSLLGMDRVSAATYCIEPSKRVL
jgi:hypothetical protein